jgi:hypothetical protein
MIQSNHVSQERVHTLAHSQLNFARPVSTRKGIGRSYAQDNCVAHPIRTSLGKKRHQSWRWIVAIHVHTAIHWIDWVKLWWIFFCYKMIWLPSKGQLDCFGCGKGGQIAYCRDIIIKDLNTVRASTRLTDEASTRTASYTHFVVFWMHSLT